MRHTVGAMGRIEIIEGDITNEKVDVIVNAANSALLGGGGVDGAIHRAAGPGLLAECQDLRSSTLADGLPPGDAIATGAHDLKKVRWIIHTVGPNRHVGQTDPETLRRCFTNSMNLARSLRSRSIAFPAIGAGAFGWEMAEVARIALEEAHKQQRSGFDKIRFVVTDSATKDVWGQVWATLPP